jgi:hypothetical protein
MRLPAIAGDESTRARVVNVQSGLPHPDYSSAAGRVESGDG